MADKRRNDHENQHESEIFNSLLQDSSIHGMYHISNKRITKFERIFWALSVAIAAIVAIYLAKSNLDHFWANPTVVSIKKDFRRWQNSFPAATACFLDRMDEYKAQNIIETKWNISKTDKKYDDYMEFIEIVSNMSYSNMKTLRKFQNDSFLLNINLAQLAVKVHPEFDGTLVTFQTPQKPSWQMILSERGICFTLNSKFPRLFSPNYTNRNEDIIEKDLLSCHALDGLCYARFDSDPQKTIFYYIHSSLDTIHATSEDPWVLVTGEEFEINFEMIETSSSANIRYLSPIQRKCRFDDEPLTSDSRVYSTSVCYILCRYEMAMKYCGCKPFFYQFLDGKTCDIQGLVCLSKYSEMFNKPPQEIGCKCPQPCDLIVYLKQLPKVTKWENSFFDERITFRWGLLQPTTKYYRDILFGLQDLLVAFGGILSLFLGMSFISFIETIYLMGELFCKYVFKSRG